MHITAAERERMIRMAWRHLFGFVVLVSLCIVGGIGSHTDFLRVLWAIIGTTMVVFLKESSNFLFSLLEAEEVEEE
jgi:hypothetical protein